jgi:dethiobiotin synthetase
LSVLVVTGTGTGVGKSVVTAAVAACHPGRVAVVKPAQTGLAPGEPGDLAEITRLSGCTDTYEFARYPDPLAPAAAARRSGLPELDLGEVVERVGALSAERDLVLVEGAGGLLVGYGGRTGWTMRELITELRADVVLVTEPGLGTLNHTALTLAALDRPAQLVIGSWPASPGLAELCNVGDLYTMAGKHLAGALPAGLAGMTDFAGRARAALSADLGGTFDVAAFRHRAHEQEQAWATSST